jgi:GTP 3',8-cyclase
LFGPFDPRRRIDIAGRSSIALFVLASCGTIDVFSEPSGAKERPTIHAPQAGRVRGEIRAPPVFGKGNRPTPNTGRHFCFCRLEEAGLRVLKRPGRFDCRRKFMLKDSYGRDIHDLRISVTDRCNFRCVYCKSADPKNYFPHKDLLEWDEFLRLARIMTGLGIRKVRVTGGEPLLRPGIIDFLSQLKQIEGIQDLALTTNGYLLAEMAGDLARAGVRRVNVSMDSSHPERFATITRTPGSYESVMRGVGAAVDAGLAPVKVNVVLVRGFNEGEILGFAELARAKNLIVRFIEFMPLDADHAWDRSKVVTAREIFETIHPVFPLVEVPRHEVSETALRYQFKDGKGEIGVVAPVSIPFCGQCSRIRLTADGKLRTCLFSLEEHDVAALLRGGVDDAAIEAFIRAAAGQKEAGHRINEPDFVQPSRTMVYIGG